MRLGIRKAEFAFGSREITMFVNRLNGDFRIIVRSVVSLRTEFERTVDLLNADECTRAINDVAKLLDPHQRAVTLHSDLGDALGLFM
jgi:hypothetical protein